LLFFLQKSFLFGLHTESPGVKAAFSSQSVLCTRKILTKRKWRQKKKRKKERKKERRKKKIFACKILMLQVRNEPRDRDYSAGLGKITITSAGGGDGLLEIVEIGCVE